MNEESMPAIESTNKPITTITTTATNANSNIFSGRTRGQLDDLKQVNLNAAYKINYLNGKLNYVLSEEELLKISKSYKMTVNDIKDYKYWLKKSKKLSNKT